MSEPRSPSRAARRVKQGKRAAQIENEQRTVIRPKPLLREMTEEIARRKMKP